jgi:uncharacterized protein YkwD
LIARSLRLQARTRALTGLLLLVLVTTMLMPSTSFASPSLEADEIAFCKLINDYRAANGLPALLVSTTLNQASDWHADDMAAKNYFSHTDSLGRDAFTRMAAFGYNYSTWKGENIAAGNSTASGTFIQWKNSTAHNTNMLSPNFKVMGIARSYTSTSTYKYYWNNTFGGYVEAGAVPCPSTAASPSPTPVPTATSTPSPTPTRTLSINDVAVYEGNSGKNMIFTVRLSSAAPGAVSVVYGTQNGTALAGSDYSASTGTATITAGLTTAKVSVPIIGERVREGNETFKVNLANPTGATIQDSQGIGTIRNDD